MELLEKVELEVQSQNNNSENLNTNLIEYLNQFAENEGDPTYGDFNYSESTYVRRT